jgi:hypothetical protein
MDPVMYAAIPAAGLIGGALLKVVVPAALAKWRSSLDRQWEQAAVAVAATHNRDSEREIGRIVAFIGQNPEAKRALRKAMGLDEVPALAKADAVVEVSVQEPPATKTVPVADWESFPSSAIRKVVNAVLADDRLPGGEPEWLNAQKRVREVAANERELRDIFNQTISTYLATHNEFKLQTKVEVLNECLDIYARMKSDTRPKLPLTLHELQMGVRRWCAAYRPSESPMAWAKLLKMATPYVTDGDGLVELIQKNRPLWGEVVAREKATVIMMNLTNSHPFTQAGIVMCFFSLYTRSRVSQINRESLRSAAAALSLDRKWPLHEPRWESSMKEITAVVKTDKQLHEIVADYRMQVEQQEVFGGRMSALTFITQCVREHVTEINKFVMEGTNWPRGG